MAVTEHMDGLHDLAERCRAGDAEAARLLYERFAERLLALVRARVSQRLSSRFDPEDVVQSVFRSFFVRLQKGEFRLTAEDDVVRLLVRITLNKTLAQIAYQRAARRDPNQEVAQADPGREAILAVMGHDPTPDEAVAFTDQLTAFLDRLRDEDRRILELRLKDYGTEEIAAKLGVSDRKVRRVFERIRGLADKADWVG